MEDNQTSATINPLGEQTLKQSSSQMSAIPVNTSTTAAEQLPMAHSLLTEMQDLRRDFETKVQYDESKERLIESLHRELQVYREGLHFRILRPIFMDIITLYDDMGKIIDTSTNTQNVAPIKVRDLSFFQDTVEEILQRYGAESFIVDSEIFQSQKQKSLKSIATTDQTLDKHIARRVRKGFLYEDKVLRPEIVETYKYVPEVPTTH